MFILNWVLALLQLRIVSNLFFIVFMTLIFITLSILSLYTFCQCLLQHINDQRLGYCEENSYLSIKKVEKFGKFFRLTESARRKRLLGFDLFIGAEQHIIDKCFANLKKKAQERVSQYFSEELGNVTGFHHFGHNSENTEY